MALDPGSSRGSAVDLGRLANNRLREKIGGKDKLDFYKFSVASSSSFSAKLKGLKANADLSLLSSSGAVLQQSKQPGTKAESLSLNNLAAGTFYIRVKGGQTVTSYRLNLFAVSSLPVPVPTPVPGAVPTPGTTPGTTPGVTPVPGATPGATPATPVPNTAPTLSGSFALSALRGNLTPSSTVITTGSLNTTDTQQNASQLTYTLTTLPKNGGLYRGSTALGLGGSFTQAEINSGLVSYQQQAITKLPVSSTLSSTVVFSGKNAAWTEGSGTSSEVFFYNGSTGVKTRLTNDTREDTDARISGETVAWAKRYSSTDRDIFYSVNAGTPTAVNTSTTFDDSNPTVSGNLVAFKRDDNSGTNVSDDGVWLHNIGGTSTQLQALSEKVANIGISGSNVVWTKEFSSTDRDVYFWDGSNLRYINSDSSFDDINPVISGNSIAFQRKDNATSTGINNGVYLYNVSSGTGGPTTQLEASTQSVSDIKISGSNVAWTRTFGASDQDLRYSIGGASAITLDNSTTLYDASAQISGSNIVFRRTDTGNAANNGLYLSAGSSPIRLSDTSASPITDVVGGMDGKNVGWTRYNILTPVEAFFYDSSTTSDSVGFTVSDGTLTTNGTLNIAIS